MNIWSTAQLSIEFETESVNEKTMSLQILYNDRIWQQKPMPEGTCVYTQEITLPAKISLIFSGRHGTTTLIDENNNIIKNMCILIKTIKLDGLPLWQFWPEFNVITECDESDDLILGSALVVNGRADLFFNEPTTFECILKSKLVSNTKC